jgi:hypothetical protein
MAASAHSWEGDADVDLGPASGHSWEAAEHVGPEGFPDGDSDSDHAAVESTPWDELLEFLLDLLLMRVLNARHFCLIMWFVWKAGLVEAKRYAFRPNAPSGHYQRHVRGCFKNVYTESQDLYRAEVPGHSKHSVGRTMHTLYISPPHESLDRDFQADSGSYLKLEEARDEHKFPKAYDDHPVVVAHPDEVVNPVNLFVDAVPYSNTDSVIGWWLINLMTGERYLFAALRKKVVCQCGCRGWCTFHAVWVVIAWFLNAMAEKVFPLSRHDFREWGAADCARRARAGTQMIVRSCLLFLKGDWAEYGSTAGFPTWQDSLRPCYKCNAYGVCMHHHGGAAHAGVLPWRVNGPDDYETGCQRCENHVVLNRDTHADIESLLHYDKRSSGSHGLALTQDYPALCLKEGDRLEVTSSFLDTSRFGDVECFPAPFVFWRPSMESITRHRNPVFGVPGVLPTRSLIVDALHALYLGQMKSFACAYIWFLLTSNVFGVVGTDDEQFTLAVLVIRGKLMDWYKARKNLFPSEGITRLSDLTRKMLGSANDRKLKTKGAETWGLLLFLVDIGAQSVHMLGHEGHLYLEAGQCMVRMVTIWRDSPGARLSQSDIDECFRLYGRYCDLTHNMHFLLQPKRHLLWHLLGDLDYFGHPGLYATWYDEALNKLLKGTTREISQTTFEQSCLHGMQQLLERESRKRKCKD